MRDSRSFFAVRGCAWTPGRVLRGLVGVFAFALLSGITTCHTSDCPAVDVHGNPLGVPCIQCSVPVTVPCMGSVWYLPEGATCLDEQRPALEDGTACGSGVGVCMAGVCEVDGFPCTEQGIRDAIAAGGGPHTFACVGPTTVATQSEISINNDVILDGRGLLTVDGQDDHRVFKVLHSGITAELRDMTITRGGGDADYGAGIYNAGALTLTDVVVTDCTGTAHGGALYQHGPSMNLTRVTLTGNSAYAGGAIGGGQGPTTITDSVLSSNTATSLGGAIYVGGITTMSGTTLSDNETLFGGAIIVIHQGELAVYDSAISGNRAQSGGGIYTHGTVTIDNSVVSDNEVTHGGGGIRQDEGMVAISNSTISGNTAQFGAGIEAATVSPNTSLLTTLNTTVSGNAAVSTGGGVVAFGTSTLALVHSTVFGNTAGNEGSAGYGTDTVTVTYKNNIIEGTCAAGSTTGTVISYGYNIESPGNTCFLTHPTDVTGVTLGNLGLGPLQDNGGPTLTHAPESSQSIAVDLVPAAACTDHGGAALVLDQRGSIRPDNLDCDAGAVEGYCENCDDGNVCATGACDPITRTCSYEQLPDWTPCPSGTGQCVGGVCYLCAGVICPPDGNECTDDVCDPATGDCSVPVPDGTACELNNHLGQCVDGVCELCADAWCPPDSNECTADLCDPATGDCVYPPAPDGTLCDSGNGECVAGECDLCPGLVCEPGNPECPCGWTYKGVSYWYAGRWGHAMAYAGPGECVMFAGHSGGNLQDIWWYNVESNSWSPGSPSTVPPHRYSHDMAYTGGDKVLMFGGTNTQGPTYGDTWIFDLLAGDWSEQALSPSPSARHGHQMVYLGDDKVLLFGGRSGTTNHADTWVYDLSDGVWTLKSPAMSPPARYQHAMARIGGDKALLFGGFGWGDTWAYDLSDDAWTPVSPAVSPITRYAHAMAWIGDDQVMLFGGYGPGAGQFGSPLDDTWIYDLSNNSWTEQIGSPDPDARLDHASCETSLDASSPAVVFGGQLDWLGNDLSPETWSFGVP